MEKNKNEVKRKLTSAEKAKISEKKATSQEVKEKTKEVLAKRINAIKNLSGK